MRDRGHPRLDDLAARRRYLGRVGRLRLCDPDAGLDVQRAVGGRVADLLQVSQAEQLEYRPARNSRLGIDDPIGSILSVSLV